MDVDIPPAASTSSTASDPRRNQGLQRVQAKPPPPPRLTMPSNAPSAPSYTPSTPSALPSQPTSPRLAHSQSLRTEGISNNLIALANGSKGPKGQDAVTTDANSFIQALFKLTELQFETLSQRKEVQQRIQNRSQNQCIADFGDRYKSDFITTVPYHNQMQKKEKKKDNETKRLEELLHQHDKDLKNQHLEFYTHFANHQGLFAPSCVTNSPRSGNTGLSQLENKKIDELEAEVKGLKEAKEAISQLQSQKHRISQLEAQVKELKASQQAPPSVQTEKNRISQLEAQVKELQTSNPVTPGTQSERNFFSKMEKSLNDHKVYTKKEIEKTHSSFKMHSEKIQIFQDHKHGIETWKQSIEEGTVSLPLAVMPQDLSNLARDVKEAQLKANEAYARATSLHEKIPQMLQNFETSLSTHSQHYNQLESLLDEMSSVKFPHFEERLGRLEQYHHACLSNAADIRRLRASIDESNNAYGSLKSQIDNRHGEHVNEQLGSSTNVPQSLLHKVDCIQVAIHSLERRYNNINTEDLYKKIARAVMETSFYQAIKDVQTFKSTVSNEIQFLNARMEQLDAPAISREITGKVNDSINHQFADFKRAQESQSESLTKQLEDLHELKSKLHAQSTAFEQFVEDYDYDKLKLSENNGEISEERSVELDKINQEFNERIKSQDSRFQELQSSVKTWTERLAALEPVEQIQRKLDALGSAEDIESLRKQMQEKHDFVERMQALNDDITNLFGELDSLRKVTAKGTSKPPSVNPVVGGLLTGTGNTSDRIGPSSSLPVPGDRPHVRSPLREIHASETTTEGPSDLTSSMNAPPNVERNSTEISASGKRDKSQPGSLEVTDGEASNPGLQIKGLSNSTPKSSKKRRRHATIIISDDEMQTPGSSRNSTSPPPSSVRISKKLKKAKKKEARAKAK
ncbi:hypothetical protein N7478_010433 [Penicillium angulare]|uniref:uncharacterized protein n=1 Tax=Penicillium angulare TaxID=116970 RepID=UPI0025423722|nr:uncharacterized protein N7478_010433 [Penicillium angulare]KAJ5267625.1 hypothetical protein N7478_010433 [Penicillium angulare]